MLKTNQVWKCFEIRQALDQVVSLYTHVVQVHAFYVQERKESYLLRYYL